LRRRRRLRRLRTTPAASTGTGTGTRLAATGDNRLTSMLGVGAALLAFGLICVAVAIPQRKGLHRR
jgi:hypothetical protein